MKKIQVYVDTSVFGGVGDEEFQEESSRFFSLVRRGRFQILVSQLTLNELAGAPQTVRDFFDALPGECVRGIPITDEVEALAQRYLENGVLTETSRSDAVHIAAATVARADLILSWNFKDIVNYGRIRRFNGVNALEGYPEIDIRSPLEIEHDDESQDL